MTRRQLTSYHDHRRRLIDWMLTRGKDPDRGRGYAQNTVEMRAYRLDRFYRAVWDAEDRYTEHITTDHADAWLLHLDDRDLSESYKASCLKALLTLFAWKEDTTNNDWSWDPVKRFSSAPVHQPRDYLTREERDQLREAALTYRSLPNYYELDEADDGERFFARFDEYDTADHAKHFILALCEEFQGHLIVVLDGASYFRAAAVTDLAARDDLTFVRLPAYTPELNPVEECWRQLKAALGNRLFDSLDELKTAIDAALDWLSVPTVSNYF